MARKARVKSSTGIYHVLVRATSDISLFTDSEDITFYLDTLRSLQVKGYCTIYAYALFDTHIHLLISEGTPNSSHKKEFLDNSRVISDNSRLKTEDVGKVMKRLASTYAYYFNVKYDHYGPIYLDRFKSEPIEDIPTFVACRNFITTQSTPNRGLITDIIPFPSDPQSLIAYHGSLIESTSLIESSPGSLIESGRNFIDYEERPPRITDSKLRSFLIENYNITSSADFLQRQDRDQTLIVTSSIDIGANVLQISRLTGLTRKVVTRMSTTGSLTRGIQE